MVDCLLFPNKRQKESRSEWEGRWGRIQIILYWGRNLCLTKRMKEENYTIKSHACTHTHTITKHVLYGFIWTKNFGVSIIAFLGHMKPIEWRLGITTVNSIVYKSPAPYLIRVPQHLYLTACDSACVPQRSNLSFLSLFHDLPTLSMKLIYWLQIKLRWRNLKTDPPYKGKNNNSVN